MIKASVAYEMMEKALHLIPSHESTSTYLSAYGVFNLESGDCVAVRAANHGTFLYNWLKMQDEPFNVDLLTSANVALTFLDGSIPFSHNNNIEMDNGAEPPVFVVRQYVYNCAVLDANDINVIISASKKLIIDGVYTDPFEEDSTKHAIIYREKTNEPSKDMTAKTLKKHRAAKKKRKLQQPTDNDNQELNTEQYMNKKLIRLTERDLHRIVKESVNRILKETLGEDTIEAEVHYYDAKGRQYRLDYLAQELRNMGINVLKTGFNDDYDGYVEVEVNLEQAKMLDTKYGSKFYIIGNGNSVEEQFADALRIYKLANRLKINKRI